MTRPWYQKVLRSPNHVRSMMVNYYGLTKLFLRDVRINRALRRISTVESRTLAEMRQRYEATYQQQDRPLVSVLIPTYNRGLLLAERTLPSVLNQSYQNFEIVIVGDRCTDDTEQRVTQLGDPRIRFENLPERGSYPEDPYSRWMVAGTVPSNRALELALGSWIAFLDDDDLFTPDHIEVLLDFARTGDYELVYGRFKTELQPDLWVERGRSTFLNGRPPYRGEGIHPSSGIYRSYLRFFKGDLEAWRYAMPGDYWVWHRMGRSGVRAGYLPRVVCLQPLRPGETMPTNTAIQRASAKVQEKEKAP